MANIMNITGFSTSQLKINANKDSASSLQNDKEMQFRDCMEKGLDTSEDKNKRNIGEKQSVQSTNVHKNKPSKLKENTKNQMENEEFVENKVIVNQDSGIVEDEAFTSIKTILSELKSQVAKILGIDVEELEKKMSEMGFNMMDLMNPQNVKDILFQFDNVKDDASLLTDEMLLQKLQLLTDVVSKVETELQELQTKYQDLLMENMSGQSVVEFNDEKVQEYGKEILLQSENKELISKVENQKQVSVLRVEQENTVGNEKNSENLTENRQNESALDENTIWNQFVNKIADSMENMDGVKETGFSRLQEMQKIVNQVVEQIHVKLSADSTSMELQLNPERLGHVNVSVVSKEGQITASFAVETQLAKEALENQMVTLKDNLVSQGIKVDAIEVSVNQNGFEQQSFQNQQNNFSDSQGKKSRSNRYMKKNQDVQGDSEKEEQLQTETIMTGGTVDFSA